MSPLSLPSASASRADGGERSVAVAVPPFAEVYRANAAFVWRILRRLGVREADLEDVCQEVFLVVHRKLADFDGGCAIRTWLFAICSRTSAAYRRRAHIRRERTYDEAHEQSAAATQADDLDQARARRKLDEILDSLDDAKRAVFVLYELERLPMNEVAEMVDCPVQTAYSRLHAARRDVEAAVRRSLARSPS